MSRTQIDGQEALYTNAQTASYTITVSDQARVVTFKSTSALTATLPQATGSFASPFWVFIQNAGSANLIVTPTTSTIDGAASIVLLANQSLMIVASSGNYLSLRGSGVSQTQSIANSLIFG